MAINENYKRYLIFLNELHKSIAILKRTYSFELLLEVIWKTITFGNSFCFLKFLCRSFFFAGIALLDLFDLRSHWSLFRMEIFEKLPRSLSKLPDMSLVSLSFLWIRHLFKINKALIWVRMKNIIVIKRVLFATKYQVYPFVQVVRYMLTLESLSMFLKEFFWWRGPGGQLYVVYSLAVWAKAKVKFLFVLKEISVVHEELRNELLDIRWVFVATFPFFVDSFEHSIWIIKFARLKLDHPLWVTSNMESNDISRATIMGAVQKSISTLRRLIVSKSVVIQSCLIQCSDRLG